MASFVPLKAKAAFAKGQIDWLTAVLRAIPVTAAGDPDTVEFVDDISANESTSASRVTLASAVVNEDAAGDEAELDAADFTHPAVTAGSDIVGSWIYAQTGGDDTTPADDRLIAFLEYTAAVTPNGGPIDVSLAAEGAVKL